jgi:hypothetical protein
VDRLTATSSPSEGGYNWPASSDLRLAEDRAAHCGALLSAEAFEPPRPVLIEGHVTHRTSWLLGSNLFSAWRDETEDEQRERYQEIADYRDVAS